MGPGWRGDWKFSLEHCSSERSILGDVDPSRSKGGLGQRRRWGAFGFCVVFKAVPVSKCSWGHRMAAVPPIRALPQAKAEDARQAVLFPAFLEIPTDGSTSLPRSGLTPTATPSGRRIRRVGWSAGSLGTRRGRGWGRSWKGSRQPAPGLPCGRRGRAGAGGPAGDACRKPGVRGRGPRWEVRSKNTLLGPDVSRGGLRPRCTPSRQRQPHPDPERDNQNCVPTLPGVPRGQNQPRSIRRNRRLRFW